LAQISVPGDTNVGNKTVGTDPVHAVVVPNLTRAYIVNRGDSTVTNYAPSVVSAAATTIALEANAGASFVDAASNFAFITETNLNRVAIVDGNQLVARAFVPVGNNPIAVAARTDGVKAYVVNNGDSTISVVSTQDNATVGTPIPVGASPVAIAMQTNGSFAYVVSDAGNSLSVIDTSSDTEIQRVTGLAAPKQVVWDNRLKRVYVVNAANSISIFNASAPQVALLRTVNTSAAPLGVAPLDDGTRFYVLYAGNPGSVDVFDAQSFSLRKTITVQNNPVSIAASPGSTKVYVVNRGGDPATASLANGSVSIIKTLDEGVLNIPPSAPNPIFVTAK
jgi:YVTN family beta-propeller protein